MLKRDSNRLFRAIAREGLNPKLFALEHVDNEISRFVTQIVLKGTELRFFIRQGSTFQDYDCKFVYFGPNITSSDVIPFDKFFNIEQLEEVFITWLHDHAGLYISEQTEPDLWQQMQLETPLVTGEALTSVDINQFTDEEKLQIKLSINEFKALIINQFEPSAVEIELIEGRLAYLTEAVDRLNRFDWRSVAISAIISMSVALTLDTEGGKLLFDLFIRAFSNIAGLLPPV